MVVGRLPENLLAAAALETRCALDDAAAAPLDVADAETLGKLPAAAADPSAECLAAAAEQIKIFRSGAWIRISNMSKVLSGNDARPEEAAVRILADEPSAECLAAAAQLYKLTPFR